MNKLTKIMLCVVCVGGALLTAGCPTEDKLKAENRTLSARLEKTEQELNQTAVERDALRGDLAKTKDELAGKDAEIAAVEDQKKQLQDAMVKLKELNDKLKKKRTVVISSVLNAQVDSALKQFAAANPDIATFDSENGMVKLKSDLTFPSGKTSINPDAEVAIKKLVTILNTPEAKKYSVYVAGHTDDVPIGKPDTRRRHPDNWYLSAHRAIGVEKALIKAGLTPSRIAVIGFGEYHPVEPNKPNKKGNAANRRVELWIVPPGSFLTDAANNADAGSDVQDVGGDTGLRKYK